MRRHRLGMTVFLALAGIGWAGAHALAQRIVMPGVPRGATPGIQEYLAYLPTSLALCVALALPLAVGATVGRRWKGLSARSLWLFGAVPVLGFLGHSLVEPLLGGHGASTAHAAAQLPGLAPVVLVGLLMQVPLALAIVALARSFLTAAEMLAHALVGPRAAPDRRDSLAFDPPRSERPPSRSIDLGRRSRAPPVPLLAST